MDSGLLVRSAALPLEGVQRCHTRMRRGQAAEKPHEREWCPEAIKKPSMQRIEGGQKHLPEQANTMQGTDQLLFGEDMKDLNYSLKKLCEHNRDGSYSTQANRERILSQIADQLHDLGFRHMTATSLKAKHVEALVALWKSQGLSEGTMKNRMAALRWLSEKIGKTKVIKPDNRDYGIGERTFVTNVSKATTVAPDKAQQVTDKYTAASLRLQEAFGLRREESIKIVPSWADNGDVLRLRDTWTKGGLYREVPITTAAQRAALDAAKALAGKGSLIPPGMRYRDQLQRFKAQCQKAGIAHVHGLRHQYAQQRYQALTGWKAPAAGGPRSRELKGERKERDRQARLAISSELGHGREQITAVYLGR